VTAACHVSPECHTWHDACVTGSHIGNDALLAAQVAVGAVNTFVDAKKDVFVGALSFGMGF
jgi:hypothetical protein